jgi:hypothetical protein
MPKLIRFCRCMRAKLLARTLRSPNDRGARAACSRLDLGEIHAMVLSPLLPYQKIITQVVFSRHPRGRTCAQRLRAVLNNSCQAAWSSDKRSCNFGSSLPFFFQVFQ